MEQKAAEKEKARLEEEAKKAAAAAAKEDARLEKEEARVCSLLPPSMTGATATPRLAYESLLLPSSRRSRSAWRRFCRCSRRRRARRASRSPRRFARGWI